MMDEVGPSGNSIQVPRAECQLGHFLVFLVLPKRRTVQEGHLDVSKIAVLLVDLHKDMKHRDVLTLQDIY